MEIWTLVKADIKHKKGSFISIILLTAIISLSIVVILSIQKNTKMGVKALWEKSAPGELSVIIREDRLTEELLKKVEDSSLTDRVEDISTVCSDGYFINDIENGNSLFMRKKDQWFIPYNQELDGYGDTDITIHPGEIYLPIGLKIDFSCEVGDTVKVYTIYSHSYEYKVAGFIAEPVTGSETIGWKQCYVSDEDFTRMFEDAAAEELKHGSEATANVHILQIYQKNDANMTSAEFRRALNQETGIIDFASGSITISDSKRYTTLVPNIITSSLLVFMLVLMAVVLVMMGHSISTGIQMDYEEFGIMKSQGFSKNKIRVVFVFQYILAEILGIISGICFAVPVLKGLNNIFFYITGILSPDGFAIWHSSLLICSMLFLSLAFIWLMTWKVTTISPVRAITGGQKTVYFDSLFRIKIRPKWLHTSLAFRQFTSKGRQYMGITFITAILVFFMMLVMVLGNVLNSKTSLEAMGFMYQEVSIGFKTELSDEQLADIEATVEEYTPICHRYYYAQLYTSFNGEQTMCGIIRNPEELPAISKGRAPLYDNEIVITSTLAEAYDLHMGDEVVVAHGEHKAEYMVVGYNQSMNDTGMIFFMSMEGSARIGIDNIYTGGYSLSDADKAGEIAEKLNELYGEIIFAQAADDTSDLDIYDDIIGMAKLFIYILSVIFALVVVHMVCTKNFIQERRDIGIYKACGFTSGMLRLQFAVRFLIISVIGAAVGIAFGLVLSGWTISQMLKMVGLSTIVVTYTPSIFILPTLVICCCFFLFAFLVSGKIKRVETKELVIE